MRVLRYWGYRLVRISDTPHSIAAGVASGAAVSFTPFLGAHFVLAFLITLIARGNFFAAAIGTVVGNPWTFPIFFALSNSIGMLILGEGTDLAVPAWSWGALFDQPAEYIVSYWPLIRTMAVGSVPVAIFMWLVFYIGVKGAITGYKLARRQRTKQQVQQGS